MLAVTAYGTLERLWISQTKRSLSMFFLNKYHVNVACRVYMAWMCMFHRADSRVIESGSEQRYWLNRCNVSDNSGRNAIAMTEKARLALIEWKSVTDHMAYAPFRGKFCNISVTSVCTPISRGDDHDKDKNFIRSFNC